jgi:plasmid stability protein
MTHALTIEVPDEVYQPLKQRAHAAGRSPEVLALEIVAQAVQPPEPGSRLLRWAGAIESDVSDAAERHDEYLGQALYDRLRGQ